MTTRPLPNVRAALLVGLRQDTVVLALQRNLGTLVAPPWPCTRVLRVGGQSDPFKLDRGVFQIEQWGEPSVESEAQTDAMTAIDLAIADFIEFRLKGETFGGVRFSGYTALTLGQSDRDASTKQERVYSRYLIAAHTP